jgi:hypothetical protein
MTTLKIQINLDNAAFEDDGLINELHDILAAIQFKIARGQTVNTIYDTNGNNVGRFEIVEGN